MLQGAESGCRYYARHTLCRIRKGTVYQRTDNFPSCSFRNAQQPGPLNGIPDVLACHVDT